MFRLEFGLRLCGPLVSCLAEIGAESLSAVTSFADAKRWRSSPRLQTPVHPTADIGRHLRARMTPRAILSVEVET
jgi:hypothetical protein